MSELIKRSEDWLDYHKGAPWETDAMKLIAELVKRVKELEQQLAAHRDATEEVAKAHKRGWEQAKADAVKVAKQTDFPISPKSYYTLGREDAANAIAAMEYKEKAND